MDTQNIKNEQELESLAHEQRTKERVKKGTVYISIISITMMFLGLSSAYVVSAGVFFLGEIPDAFFFLDQYSSYRY